jgi:ribosomal protein L37AE/L43A
MKLYKCPYCKTPTLKQLSYEPSKAKGIYKCNRCNNELEATDEWIEDFGKELPKHIPFIFR